MAETGRFGRQVRVILPPGAMLGLEGSQKILANALNRAGCQGCFSGIDISFVQEANFVADVKTFEVRPAAEGLGG